MAGITVELAHPRKLVPEYIELTALEFILVVRFLKLYPPTAKQNQSLHVSVRVWG